EFDRFGYLYIAELGHSVIRDVSPDGVIHTVVGSGTFGFSGDGGTPFLAQLENPFDVTFDGDGNFLISDLLTNRIRKVIVNSLSAQLNPTTLAFTAPAGSAPVQQS